MRQKKSLVWKVSVLLGVLVFSLLGTPIHSAEAAKNKINITYRLEAWTTTYVTGNFGENSD